jgi:sugar transferase (PEP-CTERM/EpsH1 system associated)
MNILMLTPRFPYPPIRGDTIRAWSELSHLARRHNLWLACVDERQPDPAHLAHVRGICRAVAVMPRARFASLVRGGISLVSGRSLTEGFFGRAALERVLRNWAAKIHFDAILTFSSAMAPFAELVSARRRVLDISDVDSHKWDTYARWSRLPTRWLHALEARRVALLEGRCVRAHDVTLVVNERERRRLLGRTDVRRVDVVHCGAAEADLIQVVSRNKRLTPVREPIVGCVGSMFYPPNIRAVEWFGHNVWPRVRQVVPAARWWIVGNRPVRRVRRWGREPGVTVTGFVPSVRPYLDALRVFVNPVDGDIGVQTKLLLALAAGKPAVVTPDTAGGIDYTGEPPFLVADSAAAFADAVGRVLTDDALAAELGARGRRLIEENYQTDEHLRRVERWLTGESPPEPISARSPAQRTPEAPAEVLT